MRNEEPEPSRKTPATKRHKAQDTRNKTHEQMHLEFFQTLTFITELCQNICALYSVYIGKSHGPMVQVGPQKTINLFKLNSN